MDHLGEKVKGAVPKRGELSSFSAVDTVNGRQSRMGAGLAPEELFVYECRGDGSSCKEPIGAGFLGSLPEPPYTYLFFDRHAADVMARWLRKHPGWSLTNSYRLDYSSWQQVPSREERVGPFTIRMGWHPEGTASETGSIPIRLIPGLAFGSGVHPTTRGCILALASLPVWGKIETVLDLGTGTGVLAIASALLGASRVLAVDRIPLAARAAQENIRGNGLEGRVNVVVADGPGALRKPFDILVANLEWPILERIVRQEEGRFRCTHLIVSGFLRSRWNDVAALLTPSFHTVGLEVIDDWCTATLEPGPRTD